MSTGRGRNTGSLPIGVLLAADGAVRGNAVGTLTPPGGVRYPSAWEQESATPLPRREPRPTERSGAHEPGVRSLPRRRDLRTPVARPDRDPGPRTPRNHPLNPPQFPSTLPPGVVRLDEPGTGGDASVSSPPLVSAEEPPAVQARPERRLAKDDPQATQIISRRPIRRPAGPTTGSLDIDADLFVPASERLTRQTPPGGIAARHTPSAGLPLSHLQVLSGAGTPASSDGSTPAAYPRRRDLRRRGGVAVAGPGPVSPAPTPTPAGGVSLRSAQERSAPCSGEIPLGSPLPRRRDLRHGPVAAAQVEGPRSPESEERTGSPERAGTVAVSVARAAVMTMLVGVGYAVVSGHQLSLDSEGVPVPSGSAEGTMAVGVGATERARAAASDWDARDEVEAVKVATAKQTAQRVAAARAAAERVRAAKAAAAARAAEVARATRDAQRNPKALAKILAAKRGWGNTQFTCLDLLWTRESGWNYRATNPSSGAYGIPQSLPGNKMASAGADWRTNPATQIKWGLDYIADRYGTPCGAWSHSKATGWY